MQGLKFLGITQKKPLVIVGLGNMGKTMLKGWLKNGVPEDSVRIVTPRIESAREDFPGILPDHIMVEPDQMEDEAGAIVLAVKPQKMDEVAPRYKKFRHSKPVYLSVAAGKSLNYFENIFGTDVPIVRCMPNTPCSVGYGLSGLIANLYAGKEHQDLCTNLMSSVGSVVWLDRNEEDHMNVITGISGSGPAYLFYYVECVYRAGLKNGLSPEAALLLANSTVIGSAMLLAKKLEENGNQDMVNSMLSTQLREQVTSPNGTTYAGLTRLMREDDGLQALMDETVRRAIDRSRELGTPPDKDSKD